MKNQEALTGVALLFIRLVLGAIFIAHGWQKVFGGMDEFTTMLTGLGVPAPALMAWVAALWELAGGLLVILGLFSRIAALGLAGIMAVAILKFHLAKGFFMKTGGFEYSLALLAMSLAVFLAGAGKISVDHLMAGRKGKAGP